MNRLAPVAFVSLLLCLGTSNIFPQPATQELINAVKAGDARKVGLLLRQGADPNARDGVNPVIETAAYRGREEIVLMLLDSGADWRAADSDGCNALHIAALGGHRRLVRLFLERGLPVNGQAQVDGMTPLAYAAVRGHLQALRMLLKWHADVNIPDSGGNTPLLHAAMRGRADVVRLLLAHGANVNTASTHGWTPLMAAAWEGESGIVQGLLQHGANLQATNVDGQSALSLAESAGHPLLNTSPLTANLRRPLPLPSGWPRIGCGALRQN